MTREQEIRRRIDEITEFTCFHWWPLLAEWENSPTQQFDTPTFGAVVRDIITTRGRYVRKLEAELTRLPREVRGDLM